MSNREWRTPVEFLSLPYDYADEDIVSCFKRLGLAEKEKKKDENHANSSKNHVVPLTNTNK